MRAMDVMTTNVITVSPDTSVQEVAKILSERSISGVPVVDAENRLVGIVSEGDLLHRVEMGTDRRPDRRTGRRRSWWLDTVGSDEELARAYVKSHGRTARDVMTSEVTSVNETTELADIANLLETRRIKRVPVVRDGKLVGIVSRANLVRALAAAGSRLTPTPPPTTAGFAKNSWPNYRGRSGFTPGRPTSSSGMVSCISGCPTTAPKKSGRPCASPPRTSPAFAASRSTSCRLR